ncbi:MAG: Asp-tRNA(Asn)/Glu-tRNA(Gln) amidotransferase subunit GatC [bacterium]
MSLSKQEVEHIAKLAKLNITEEEKNQYAEQLSNILDYIGKMNLIDMSAVKPTSQVTGLVNITRTDVRVDSEIEKELVACAPEVALNQIKVPTILKEK